MSLRLELFVSDLEKSAEFYTKVLGFERQPGEDDYLPVRSGSVVIGLGPTAGLPKRHYFNPELQTAWRGLGTEYRAGS
ncbi:MAG: VOC family protein [Pirellulales bacterium]|nr:VOC family protein [Pirellulales bacterium]